MNFGDLALVQSNPQLPLQPETELKFADFLINQAMDAAFCLGAKGQFFYVNDATCRLSEYSREELLSTTLHDIDVNFSLHKWSKKWQYLTAKGSLTFESRYRTKKGRILLLEITIIYLQHQGREFGCAFAREKSHEVVELSLQNSIYELQEAKEHLQQKVAALKSQEAHLKTSLAQKHTEKEVNFFSMLCHQFRTPLNIVSFSNSLLKRYLNEWTEEKTRSLLDRIQTSVEQINQLLDDLLFLAKAEAAKLNVEPQPVDLVQFCHDLVEKMQISDSQNRIVFVSQGKALNAYIDKELLEPILQNLLDNAIKYSPSRSPVDFKLSTRNDQIIFQIQDQGIGISPKERERLFEPFYRGSNINHIPGSGLGLSIVKALVDLHKGQIAVEGEVDVGTTVTFMLPYSELGIGTGELTS